MARQFIYHMADLTKAYGTKKVLENLNISFYPDAKIGILGPNGAGKSTVLKIMAGIDTEWSGEAWLAEGATVGYLAQEPQLDPALNVFGNVMEGVAAKKAIIDRYNELMMNYSDETAEEGARLQDLIDSQNLWDLDAQVEQSMDALVGIELRLLREVADARALGHPGFAVIFAVEPGHDLEQRRFAGAVRPEHADLGVGVEREVDAVEDLLRPIGL